MHKIILLLIFFAATYLLIPEGLASIGTAIAPATASYNLTLDGMTIDFVVYNTGSEDAIYTLAINGTAANFTSIEPAQAEIKAGGYAAFKAVIKPTKDTKASETYTLITNAQIASPGTITVSAKSRINLFYLGKKVVVPPPPVTEAVELIAAGEIGIFSYEVDTGITDIVVEVANDVSNVEITVTSQTTQPATVAIATPGYSYLYLIVTKINIEDADISKATIKFKVEKFWINDNNISSSTVALYQYSDDKWNKLPTIKLTEDDTSIYYQAESPGLSVFAISGEKVVRPFVEIKKKISEKPILYAVIGIVVTALIVWAIYYRKIKTPRPRYKRKGR